MNNNTQAIGLSGSIDSGWFTRGTGFAYKSLAGYSTLRGRRFGKVMSVATRSKACAFCSKGHSQSDHRCCDNWSGSSKAMEPSMAVELISDNPLLKQQNANITVVIGDNDAATMAAINKRTTTPIEKWNDYNHTYKSFVNNLYVLKVSPAIRKSLSYLFACAIKNNKNNPDGVKNAILNIEYHTYGEHGKCGEWCKASDLGKKYIYRYFPKGQPLSNMDFRTKLQTLLSKYAANARAIAPCGSSQKNEAINSCTTKKYRKARCYARSESHVARVKAAAAEINEGPEYIISINKQLFLSPGKGTKKYREAKARLKEKISLKSKTMEYRRRRLYKKQMRNQVIERQVRDEGVTYEKDSSYRKTS